MRNNVHFAVDSLNSVPHSLAIGSIVTALAGDSKMTNITETSLVVFLAYANDAGNWNGQPLVGGNVGGSKEERGNITQLKQAGLITTEIDEGCTWLQFTESGKFLALEHGIEI
jgi:hypothetical protein